MRRICHKDVPFDDVPRRKRTYAERIKWTLMLRRVRAWVRSK